MTTPGTFSKHVSFWAQSRKHTIKSVNEAPHRNGGECSIQLSFQFNEQKAQSKDRMAIKQTATKSVLHMYALGTLVIERKSRFSLRRRRRKPVLRKL